MSISTETSKENGVKRQLKTRHPNKAMAYTTDDATSMSVVEDYGLGDPGYGEVVVELETSGVCQSDLSARDPNGRFASKLIGGHEGVGRIVAIGLNVERKVGDRVGVPCFAGCCTYCDVCVSGYESHCAKAQFAGFTINGTFARYIRYSSNFLVEVPEEMNAHEACVFMCAGVTVYRALRLGNAPAGSWVCIPGAAGGLGHLAVQYAKVMGFCVIGIDAGAKESFAKQCGVDAFVDFQTCTDIVGEVKRLTNGGVSLALVTAASSQSYADAVGYTRHLGAVMCVGLAKAPASISIPDIIAKALRVMGTATGTRSDCRRALALAIEGKVVPQITLRKLEEVNDVLNEMVRGALQGRVVLDLTS